MYFSRSANAVFKHEIQPLLQTGLLEEDVYIYMFYNLNVLGIVVDKTSVLEQDFQFVSALITLARVVMLKSSMLAKWP